MEPIIIIRDDLRRQNRFNVQVNQVKLFRNFSLEDAIIGYFSMVAVGRYACPKGAEAICELLQQYFLDNTEGLSTRAILRLVNDFTETVARLETSAIKNEY